MTAGKIFAAAALTLATAGAAGAIALNPDRPLPFDRQAAAPQALIPGHLGSVLTQQEQRLLVEAWRDHDDVAASFILMGGMRTPLPAATN